MTTKVRNKKKKACFKVLTRVETMCFYQDRCRYFTGNDVENWCRGIPVSPLIIRFHNISDVLCWSGRWRRISSVPWEEATMQRNTGTVSPITDACGNHAFICAFRDCMYWTLFFVQVMSETTKKQTVVRHLAVRFAWTKVIGVTVYHGVIGPSWNAS